MPYSLDLDSTYKDVACLFEIVNSETEEYHEKSNDSTRILMRTFGEPEPDKCNTLLRLPSRKERASLLQMFDFSCQICHTKNNLSFIWDSERNKWNLYCDSHHSLHHDISNLYSCDIIPYEVRRETWHRDKGKCIICGSTNKIAMGHFIPRNRGKFDFFSGSNGYNNIQLLCQTCNSSESNNL